MHRLLALSTAAAMAALATPAAAQDAGGDRVNTLIIYGDDECPASSDSEITVCARMDENERFRIPEALRGSDSPANKPWAERVRSFEAVGNFGPLSCSAVGLGGELGCTAAMIQQAYEEKANSSTVRFTELVAKAREERLSGIDEEAADTQRRVEAIEAEYDARIAREQAAGQSEPTPDGE
ncbi:hypothetical protein [Tsuneonella sp. HG222]